MNPDAVAESIVKMFGDRGRRPRGKFERFQIVGTASQIFPEDYRLRYAASRDPLLARYAAIEPALRKNGLYLFEATGDYYWPSEYYYNDVPAKFRCAFIMHLEADAPSGTKIEVLEFGPTIWVGKAFHLLGHHGPDFYYDIRPVEPTAQERLELLELLRDRLAGQAVTATR